MVQTLWFVKEKGFLRGGWDLLRWEFGRKVGFRYGKEGILCVPFCCEYAYLPCWGMNTRVDEARWFLAQETR